MSTASSSSSIASSAPSRSLPRVMLRRLAAQASQNPIEVIVTIFIIVTLAYFQLVHAVTHSNFFEPITQEASSLFAQSTRSNLTGKLVADDVLPVHSLHDQLDSVFVRKAGNKDAWIPFRQYLSDNHVPTVPDHIDASSLFDSSAKSFTVEPVFVTDAEQGTISSAIQQALLASLAENLATRFSDAKTAKALLVSDANTGHHAYVFGKSFSSHSPDDVQDKQLFLDDIANPFRLSTTLNQTIHDVFQSSSSYAMHSANQVEQFLDSLKLAPLVPDSQFNLYAPNNLKGTHVSLSTQEFISIRWLAYAFRALVIRFWALIKKADSADLFVMLSAYILMHGTFVNLFLSMRKFGSNFWLGASVLASSTFAFLLALTFAFYLGVTVDPICLSEALPFLVILVGFEKPYRLTRAVFTHPDALPSSISEAQNKEQTDLLLSTLDQTRPDINTLAKTDTTKAVAMSREESFVRALTERLKNQVTSRWAAPNPTPAHEIVVAAVNRVGLAIIRDYAIEIAVMAVGATSGVSGLREFCQLAALILVFDCTFLFVFYVSILTVMVEVHRIKVKRGSKRPKVAGSPLNLDTSEAISSSTPSSPTSSASSRNSSPSRTSRPVWHKLFKAVVGRFPFENRPQSDSPVARLKLLLISAFLILHSLNLISTLTTQSAITRHHSTYEPSAYHTVASASSIYDPSALASISPLLLQLSQSQPAQVDLIAQVSDPTILVLFDAKSAISGTKNALAMAALNASGVSSQSSASSIRGIPKSHGSSSLAVLDSFMSGWTGIVGDPVIGKWMSLALGISIFLNAYLLKGIATGNAAVTEGNAAGAAVYAAARFIGAHLDSEAQAMEQERGGGRKRWTSREDKPTLSLRATTTNGIADYHKKLAAASAVASESISKLALESEPLQRQHAESQSRIPVPANAISSDASKTVPTTFKFSSATFVAPGGEEVVRSFEELAEIYAGGAGVFFLSDEEIILLAQKGKIAPYALEKILQDFERAVRVRRALVSRASATKTLEASLLPHKDYDYSKVMGACCENVVGYMPIPVGIAGPLVIDGETLPIPMATTEGTLIASTSRGCKALNAGGGVTTVLTQDAMTRGPALEFPSVTSAARAKRWIDSQEGASIMKAAFDSTSRFARLSSLRCVMAGRTLYIRFATSTGDAMGMNMISKGVEKSLNLMNEQYFPEMKVLSLSGNYCTDKKPAAINWIEGRGKSVVAEAIVPGHIVKSVLKSSVADMVNLNLKKNLIGSAMAGSIGGFNAHAANILTAMYIATGQDPAQNVESSNCMTLMEAINDGQDLLITVSMPSIEVGTVGGGTVLPPQRAMLELLGIAGAHPTTPGANAQRLARVIAAAVMAGELSLMGALSAGHLIQAHMKHNRSVPNTPGTMTPLPRPETPKHFAASMTPLVAPSVIQSQKTSPTNSQFLTTPFSSSNSLPNSTRKPNDAAQS